MYSHDSHYSHIPMKEKPMMLYIKSQSHTQSSTHCDENEDTESDVDEDEEEEEEEVPVLDEQEEKD